MRGLVARLLFKVPPCPKGTIHLQRSMSSPRFEHRLNGIAVSVTNHYTGWATNDRVNTLFALLFKSMVADSNECSPYA
ncbi:hypothetical protein TNCV_857151 [Trichonephila clavipes]|nr:hypothetical protein TNCV_857151 [Trichonephila clavipes]